MAGIADGSKTSRPVIVDSTLRDGEQAPGVVFNLKEKVAIAKLLDLLGVEIIEAGTPIMGELEQQALRKICGLGLRARVVSWNRLLLSDIRASLACGVRDIHISAPVSDLHIQVKLGKNKQWVLDCLKRAMRYAFDYGCRVSVGSEDASRADFRFLMEFALLAQEMGAERFRYADTVGILDPFSTRRVVGALVKKLSIPVEFHGHNDFGMATANSVAAFTAGATHITTTVGGLGERAGNTCLEDILKIFHKTFKNTGVFNLDILPVLSRYVAIAANRPHLASGLNLQTPRTNLY
jgi:homocitrate synthase NifV